MYEHDPFPSVMGTIHEAGHGMYEQGMDADLRGPAGQFTRRRLACTSRSRGCGRTSLGAAAGSGSTTPRSWPRFWARSLDGTSAEDVYRHVNLVQPSLIRVDADEVTYNLHVLIRFELELALMRDELEVADLPGAWNDAYQRHLGIRPPHDGDGVLQDTHWSGGAFGYFPTYTLGTIYSAMLWDRLAVRPARHRRARSRPASSHRCWAGCESTCIGRDRCTRAPELIERVTGSELDHRPLMRYLCGKFGPLYGLEGA